MTAMTADEILTACTALRSIIHPQAIVTASVEIGSYRGNNPTAQISIYPRGYSSSFGDNANFSVYGATWAEVFDLAYAKWAEIRERVGAERIKQMALAIIRLTHELGECTDAALRVAFNHQDVTAFAGAAADLANTMAAGGPFSVTTTDAKANAPAVLDEFQLDHALQLRPTTGE